MVSYLDDFGLVPELKAFVFLGQNLADDDEGTPFRTLQALQLKRAMRRAVGGGLVDGTVTLALAAPSGGATITPPRAVIRSWPSSRRRSPSPGRQPSLLRPQN
jgi:hypothetical protein